MLKNSILLSLLGVILSCTNEPTMFSPLNASETGISFINTNKETKDFNILDYLYFYNGGGVSAGDINNDGLVDLFFVSNQNTNVLYLNKGLKKGKPYFENISESAGIDGFSDWNTGVTMADVNGDGYLDIYVCAVGNYKGLEGSNELYINNGDLTFTEKSQEYGLDFTGFSTQAAFFDFDKDGDLDCYLLNHAVHNSRSYDRVNTRSLKDNEAGDILYRNDNGLFKNISEEAGIYQASMGYGLGLSVADINNDGWTDIYVSNDFHEDDYYYINQKDGTFKESVKEHFKHLSRFSMGSDIADINNDGYQDIMTLDMYPEDETVEKSSVGEDPLDIYLYKLRFGYFNQYSRNCLQLSMSGERFSDIAPSAGVMATDWSWSTLMADYDLDGIKDIFISNGIKRRPNDLDYLKFILADSLHYNLPTSHELDQEAINKMPEGKWHNYLYQGTKELVFNDKSYVWGFKEKSISNGSIYTDLDNDGDLDLVTNNLDSEARVYLNNSRDLTKNNYLKIKFKGEAKNTFGIGAKAIIKTAEGKQILQLMPTRGFLSSVEPVLLFGLGKQTKIDSLSIIWENNKAEILLNPKINSTIIVEQKNATLKVNTSFIVEPAKKFFYDASKHLNFVYKHKENTYYDFNRELLMPFKVSVEGPKITVGDVNNDGLEDFYASGAKYQEGELYIQNENGGFERSMQEAFKLDSLQEDVEALFFDADSDKDQDIYVVSGGNEFYGGMVQQFDRLYINDGKGNFSKNSSALPEMFENKSCVKAADFDADGDLDLFVGGRVKAYNYGISPQSFLLINNGKGVFTNKTKELAPELAQVGMVTDAVWADTDGDGDQDLTVVGDWMPIVTFENNGKGLVKINNGLSEKFGFWNAISLEDMDKDGDLDLIVGNLGTNTKMRKEENGSLKMWVKDFDENEALDQVVGYNRGNEYYPIYAKDEMGKQLPSIINKRFTEYKDFAGKSISEIFTKQQLKGAEVKLVNKFESVYLENKGNNNFEMHDLPSLAQVSKVMATHIEDVNKDGIPDVLIGGNFNGASMYQAQYDAFFGLILLGNSKGLFTPLMPTESGFFMDGFVRDISPIIISGKSYYLISKNNDGIQAIGKL